MSAYVPPLNVMRSHRGTVGALFHARVTVNPTHRAVVDGDRVLNYEELEERSNQLANALLSQGLQQGDRVGLLERNRLEYGGGVGGGESRVDCGVLKLASCRSGIAALY